MLRVNLTSHTTCVCVCVCDNSLSRALPIYSLLNRDNKRDKRQRREVGPIAQRLLCLRVAAGHPQAAHERRIFVVAAAT